MWYFMAELEKKKSEISSHSAVTCPIDDSVSNITHGYKDVKKPHTEES